MKKPVLLTILDGFGFRDEVFGNAVKQAKKPNFDRYYEKYPHTTLRADGEFVGLPKGQMGNSEVGHLNIGAGRVVYQSLALLNKEIDEKTFFENNVLKKAIDNAKNNSLHIIGLLSDGGVHSHINHIIALLEMAKINDVKNVYIHCILDGRDVEPESAIKYIKQLEEKINEFQVGKIASISGRYYSMDRDKRWDRIEKAYDAIVCADGNSFIDPIEYINSEYQNDRSDEFILPAYNANVCQKINDNDSVIFANFRPDRAIQLSSVLTNKDYNPKKENPIFIPKYRPQNLVFVQMMKYSDDVIGDIAFSLEELKNTLGDVVSGNNLTQVRIAETEKYPHVTFFFDGGIEKEIKGCKRVLIDSPKVATYDLKPEMSAYEVCDSLLKLIEENNTDLYILNFANPDMVGHSGKLEPTIKAIEAVDECLGKIVDALLAKGGYALITADHGNADKVLNEDGTPNTAHTTEKVPVIVTKENIELRTDGALCDIAPTLLDLLNVEKPKEMTGKSLIKE